MFKISFSPQYSDAVLSLEKRGNVLIVNGDELDFSDLTDGGEYPPEAIDNPSVVGGVERVGGEIRLTIILPYMMPGHFETPPPITVINDGPIDLPEGHYPPPVEDLPIPEPIAEGEDNAAQ
ncbi:hypothetical protein N7376_22200 [Brucella intermedia GD04153]|uniref:Uncharacterized protein n=1 Tax=Brucella intermedia GD04153 TaxID=2975438 RepID=A0AA42H2N0_9HYPH|nr:hypothetical protein [Brucella intermedia]MDH0126692.1 hypothetical protein [Brucella intermedia GD04153]